MIGAAISEMSFVVRDTGALELCTPWLPLIAFTPEFLSRADGRRVAVRGDEVTIRCCNAAATYALGPMRADGMRAGTLLSAWGP